MRAFVHRLDVEITAQLFDIRDDNGKLCMGIRSQGTQEPAQVVVGLVGPEMRFDCVAILCYPFRDLIPLTSRRAAPDDSQGAGLQVGEYRHFRDNPFAGSLTTRHFSRGGPQLDELL